jgi:nitrate/nitrite-specific signal transduction histidine kinase
MVSIIKRDPKDIPEKVPRKDVQNRPAKAETSTGILICISDDGAGFTGEATRGNPASLGMRIMRERAAAIGVRLNFISESDTGLMVRIELPPPPV